MTFDTLEKMLRQSGCTMTDIGTWTSGRGVVERWRTEDGREFALEFSMNVEWLRAEVRVFITEPVYGGPVDNVAAFLSC